MSANSKIEWTDSTFNVIWGCTRFSEACRHCYAETLAKRYGFDVWGVDKERRTFGEKHWAEPLKWNRTALLANERRRVFCSSMGDVFEDHPTVRGELPRLWDLIRKTPMLDWQLLKKRADRIAESLPADWGEGYHNVWLGVTLESMDVAARADALRAVPAHVRFLSCEPLLGALDYLDLTGISWVIIGGESGPGHREMDLDAAGRIALFAHDFGAAVFVKQDSGPRSGQQGRIPDWMWALKNFPTPSEVLA